MRCKITALAFFLSVPLIFSPATEAQSPSTKHLDAVTLDRYAGQYRSGDEPDVVYSVFREGDHLTIEAARSPRITLTPESATSFASKEPEGHLDFIIDAAGKVTGAKAKTGSFEMTLERISDQPLHNHFRPYSRQVVMIPMRDGVRLHAIILRPTDTSEPLPFLMQRTPYGVDGSDSDFINARFPEPAESGLLFGMEDLCGRYGSEGQFAM